jgi:hypothetical protein
MSPLPSSSCSKLLGSVASVEVIGGDLVATMFSNDDDGVNKRRRIRIDDEDDDEIGSNPDEMLNDQPDAESEEEGEDLIDTWKE